MLLSDVVADQVIRLRKRARLRRDQLADRCQELGASDLTAATLANIETGRRDKATGKRRRRVTVEELLALALALEVPPVSLLADLKGGPIPVGEDITLDPVTAVLWLAGKEPLDGRHTAAWEEPAVLLSWVYGAHEALTRLEGLGQAESSRPRPPTAEQEAAVDKLARRDLDLLSWCLQHLVDHGAVVPVPPEHILERAAELGVKLPSQKGGAP